MNKFEEAICGHNPLYKEGLQDKYYQGAKWAWQSRQAEVDELQEEYVDTELYLRGQLTDRDSKIANLEYLLEQDKSLIPILNKKLEEKDKRIEAAVRLMDLAASDGTECVEIGELYQALRGEHE
ncbi:hypothetical protein [Acinetobacter guillouiae]|uniref:hypothetical protein n=1 Tax=Acinetobacter guillouiae TaxID=106649 RepID=UPI003AF71C55